MPVFSSTIIPTINRPTLTRAVESVLEQDFFFDDFEVIVVNDTGLPLPRMEWMASERVRVVDTNRHERSTARNTGAAIAKGRYLHFLDDDDALLPGALHAFWELDQARGDAIWLSGSYQAVDVSGNLLEEIHPQHKGNNFALLVSGEGIPFGASLLDSHYFFKVGCFDPKMNVIEDRDLAKRIAMVGTICHTNELIAQFRVGLVGSTTDWSALAEGDRVSRENALNLKGSFSRLWDSAKTCVWHGQVRRSYWHGRVCRAYFASIVWNLKHGNFLISLSRLISALTFMNWHIFSPDFYSGMRQIDPFTKLQVLPEVPSRNTIIHDNRLPVGGEKSK